MSSIDRETGVEEIRKMTMQWDYGYVPSANLREKNRDSIQFSLPDSLQSLVEVGCTLLGAATTIFAVVWLSRWLLP